AEPSRQRELQLVRLDQAIARDGPGHRLERLRDHPAIARGEQRGTGALAEIARRAALLVEQPREPVEDAIVGQARGLKGLAIGGCSGADVARLLERGRGFERACRPGGFVAGQRAGPGRLDQLDGGTSGGACGLELLCCLPREELAFEILPGGGRASVALRRDAKLALLERALPLGHELRA